MKGAINPWSLKICTAFLPLLDEKNPTQLFVDSSDAICSIVQKKITKLKLLFTYVNLEISQNAGQIWFVIEGNKDVPIYSQTWWQGRVW